MELSSDDLVDLGEIYHKAGQLQHAEAHYRKALEIDPAHPGALYFLANIAYDDQRLELATELVQQLLKDEPQDAEGWHLLGMIALKASNLELAREYVQKALLIQPAYALAHYSLGDILSRHGDKALACESFQRAATLNPQYAEAHFAIGNILASQENLDEAIESFKKALMSKPDMELAYLSIGQLLARQGKFSNAIDIYRQALSYCPRSAKILNDLGNTQLQNGSRGEAAASFEMAIQLDPELIQPYDNMGNLLLESGKIEEGLEYLRKAVALDPNCARSKLNMAGALIKAGRQAEAVTWIKESLEIDPSDSDAYSFYLCALQYVHDYPREKSFQDHRVFGERFEAEFKTAWPVKPFAPRPIGKKLRVAFVSGDLCGHPVGYFLEGVLRELHKNNSFDIYVYYTDAGEDLLTYRLRASSHVWTGVKGMSNDALAQRIKDDAIDILIDLSGHTANNRLLVFARKAAPIQISWLGYWDTTGLSSIDYLLCDPYSVHEGEEEFFVEKLWKLPHTRLCFTPPRDQVSVAPLPALSSGLITFGCFNNLNKITDRVVSVWAKILRRVPNSRLFLKWSTLSDEHVRAGIIDRFAIHHITAERLVMEGASPRAEYLAAYGRVDIALDPFPFSGGTTSFEGVWMGVPMITLKGDRIIARQGESILHNIGLPGWIAMTEEHYIDLAVEKTRNLQDLATLRRELRQRIECSPLCDAELFARNLEAAFDSMWKRYITSSAISV